MKKLFTISALLICLSVSLIHAGGYWRIKSTKKGSELQAEIQKAIGIESTIEIREPDPSYVTLGSVNEI